MSLLHSLTHPGSLRSANGSPAREARRVSEGARRRALVNTVLADVLRKQSIPSDWVRCSTLEAISRGGRPRTYVQLIVLKGDDSLLPLLAELQDSVKRELQRQDSKGGDWLASVCWEFRGERDQRFAQMPEPAYWA